MIYTLFAILWGALSSLILCAPYSYYPLFLSLFIISIIIFIMFKKVFIRFKNYKMIFYICLFILSYTVSAYVVFKVTPISISPNITPSSNKTAVIFYCEGEMEKYTPYYSKSFLDNVPLIKKPFEAFNLKRMYQSLGVNNKNSDLIKSALDVKQSIVNYKPYYFYIGFSDYSPSLDDSIKCALRDGCGKIIVINYSDDDSIEKSINKEDINKYKVSIIFTKPVFETNVVSDILTTKIINLPSKADGILLIDRGSTTSQNIKNGLLEYGYTEKQIVISDDINKSMKYFINEGAKNVLYLNVRESSSGIYSEVECINILQKYDKDLKITGFKSWGYDKKLVKASINLFLEAENNH